MLFPLLACFLAILIYGTCIYAMYKHFTDRANFSFDDNPYKRRPPSPPIL